MKSENRYILDFVQNNQFHAGSKAREDINCILKENGFKSINIKLYNPKKQSILAKLLRNTSVILQVFIKASFLDKKSIVIYQYPFLKPKVSAFLKKFFKIKQIIFIPLIHDIDSIRFQKGEKAIEKEKKDLSNYKYLIVHNYKMKDLLINKFKISSDKLYELVLFDYLTCDNKEFIYNENKNMITIAGNLSKDKAPYIYKLNNLDMQNISFRLYGVNYEEENKNKNIEYKGIFKPDNIPFNNGFGLVWDGDSLDTCSGDTGEYTRINNPHKLSLYMAAGIPVFVWKEAAIAHFVKENKVGFCIESLNEIDDIIGNLTDEQYEELLRNVKVISQRVKKGYYTLSVLEKIYNDIETKRKNK